MLDETLRRIHASLTSSLDAGHQVVVLPRHDAHILKNLLVHVSELESRIVDMAEFLRKAKSATSRATGLEPHFGE